MLPRTFCQRSVSRTAEGWAINYFAERDHRWLDALLQVYRAHVGHKHGVLRRTLTDPLQARAPKAKLAIARHVLDGFCRSQPESPLPPREVRQTLFALAAPGARFRSDSEPRRAGTGFDRSLVVAHAARALGATPDAVEHSLFADLKGEQLVAELPPEWGAEHLAAHSNFALVSGLLARAHQMGVELATDPRAIVKYCRRAGLICTVEPRTQPSTQLARFAQPSERSPQPVRLNVSGPLSLFKPTRLYTRALAGLLPLLLERPFTLTATCLLAPRAEPVLLEIDTCALNLAAPRPLPTDDPLERRFTSEFRKLAPEWQLSVDPEPLQLGRRWLFADFAIEQPGCGRRWLFEIIRFWTSEFLDEKLRSLAHAGGERVLLCVRAQQSSPPNDSPQHAGVLYYRRSIDAREVLAELKRRCPLSPREGV